MQNVSNDTTNNTEKIDKGSNLQELGKVSTSQSFSSPIKSEFNTSYAEIFLSDTSESDDDDVSEVEPFVIDEDDLADEIEMEEKYYIPSEEESEDHTVDPETQARLEALLEAAGIGKLATGDSKLADPEVLRRLTSSVSCALDEAAAALTRMRNENPRPNIERSLVQACSDGDVKTVKKLLIEGRSVHETTDEGESLLSLACSAGYYELAQVLLAMHANVEDRGIKGECTPLMEAASSGFIEIVRLLVNHGADVNGQSSSGNTPLMYACAGGHEAVVRVLLECGGNVEDHNENGHTPLMEAASAGHVGVAKILLEYGAGINTHSNEFKESALTLACYKGHLDMVRFLLSAGADQEHKTDEMHTALMEASMDGHVEVAKLLLDSGAQVNMPTDSFESPLTLAACGGHVDLALLLIERGANIEEVNDEGYTPLMEAAREGHEEMVCVLLQKGAKINAHTEETQETALTLACCGGFLDVADFLLKNGANIELGASTPLMEAAQEGHLDLVRYLLDTGAQVHAKTQTGDTALTYACENGHTDVADLLLSYGANLEHESEGGRTPLMKACRAGHICTVQFLMSKSADVNRQTSNNDHTPLSLACAGGHLNVVQLLLAHNADPYHKLKDNSTMLIEAAKGGHTNVVQLLLDFPRSISSPSEESTPHVCSQGDREVLCCGVPLGPALSEEAVAPQETPTASAAAHTPSVEATLANPTEPVCVAAPTTNLPNAEKVREKLHSLNLKQLKLLQKEKQHLQELQTKHIDILEFRKKKKVESSGKVAISAPSSNGVDLSEKTPKQTPPSSVKTPSGVQGDPSKQTQSVKSGSEPPNNIKPKPQKQKVVPAPTLVQSQTPEDESNVSASVSSNKPPSTNKAKSLTSAAKSQTTTSVVSNNPTTSAVTQTTLAESKRQPTAKSQTTASSVANIQTIPCANSQSTAVNSQTTSVNSQTTTVNSQSTSVNNFNSQASPATSQSTCGNSQLPPVNNEQTSAVSSIRVRDVLSVNAALEKAASPDAPALAAQRKWRQSVPTIAVPQQVKNVPQQLPLDDTLNPADLNDAKMNYLLQDPKCQGPLANFFQSQLFIDHLKRMNGEETQTLPLCPGDPPSTPSPPLTPPPGESPHRPLTPPLPPLSYFGAEGTQPPRPGALQGIVSAQPLFHPGANTTVLHNTIYTRSSVPVPSPADVNQSTAIADRPKAKPVSKKEGKTVKKHHLAAYHFAMQQQKEALQLKQLVEMNEQLVSQVVSQQTQLGLSSQQEEAGAGEADPLARSKLLASSAKEMMDQETRDLIDQLETITMEEVERVASQGQQRKLLQDKLQGYAAGLQDGLKMAVGNVAGMSDPRVNIGMNEPRVTAGVTDPRVTAGVNDPRVTIGVNDPRITAGVIDPRVIIGVNDPRVAGVNDPRFQQVGVNFVGSQMGGGAGEEAYQYFTVPSPGGPLQVQQYSNGFQLQYQVSRQDMAQYSKVDANGSPFSSPTLSPKNGSPPPPVPATTHVVATQTSPSSPSPAPVEAPPPCVRKAAQNVVTLAAHPGAKTKKRDARPNSSSACQTSTVASLDPSQPRFPGTDTPSAAGSVTTSYSGMDVDSETESNHDTALTLACAGGHEDLVELLLSRGADIEHRDKKGFTPLILAATAGHDKVVDILLNHVADMEAQSERTKDTPLSLACSGGRYEVVELLLTRGANKEHRNVSDYTPLSLAASGGYVNIIKLLLTHGAEINSRTGSKLGISPLMLAAMNGHTAAVRLLLDMGSDINAQIETNRNTALTLACFQGRHEVVSLLLDRKANVEHRAKTGLTPLMEAASGGYVEVGRVLLDKGADVNAPPVPSSRDTALTIAADKGHCRFVELLLSKGALVEVKNKKGNSPLWLAANGGHLSVVELLCKHRADIDSQDNRKVSCLMAAFRKGHVKAVRWMVNHVAQFPSDQEMTRYIQTVNDKELLDKCQECSMVIRVAKNQQAEKANKNANILLEELDMEKWREESKRAAQARKRERKKQKKLEKKEEKRKAKEEVEEEEEEEEEMGEEEENDIETSTAREGEEGDSGIDANSQASCSSNEVKPSSAPPTSKRKDKKKKKSASASSVPAKLSSGSGGKTQNGGGASSSSNHSSIQKNASSSAVPSSSSKQPTETTSVKSPSVKSTVEAPSKKEKKKQQQQAVAPQQQQQQQQPSSSNTPSAAASSSQAAVASSKEAKSKTKASTAAPVAPVAAADSKSETSSSSSGGGSVTTPPASSTSAGGTKEKKTKEKVTTPRKEPPQHLIFESTRHPAEREEFEATGGGGGGGGTGGGGEAKDRKRASLMSLYSDGELIASSSAGVKIPPSKQGPNGGKREEGWKEVVRKYLNTTFRHKKVSVPLNAISRVIGRGGSNINAIRSATSAHIEVEKQCKGQGERIITIKGNNDAIKQANTLINSLIRDPDVDLMRLLAESGSPSPLPPTTAAPVSSKQISKPPAAPAPSNAAPAKPSSGPAVAPPASAPPPPLLGSLTFVKAPSHPAPALPTTQAMSAAPTPLIPGLRTSAPPRTSASRIGAAVAGGEKRLPRRPAPPAAPHVKHPPVSPSLSPQPRPPPTASAPPSISAPPCAPPDPVLVAPQAPPPPASAAPPSPSPPQPPPQPQPAQGLTEYSLFNDTFTKVTQQSVWGRDDGGCEDSKNFASVAAASSGNPGNGSSGCSSELPPSPSADVANLAKAPGYRGASTSTVASPPVLCNTASPLYHQPRPTSVYIEDPSPLYQQDLLKMVPGPSYIPTTISMSRLNPRAPDFSCVKTQSSQQQPPLFNSAVAPPTHIPPPVVAFSSQPTRWPYPMSYSQQPPDMMSHLASLALANNQAGDLFSTTLEMTPPTSPPHSHDERKVQPRPIGTERAWKNYNNVIGGTPVEETAPWLHQDTKTFGGIGENRHMFRSSGAGAMPQYAQDLAPPLPSATHLLDNYQEAHYNMNGGTTLMLLPQQQQQQQQPTFGLASLLPDSYKVDNSWDPARLCLADKQPPQVWTKWTN